eukprot:TRINITY_DN17672_c0_g1_i1.p1 TRINITY_DN17672_c0_g1~~TRINITY_DN17672_c0_g1_i1.p1  ORF type:complete len:184 (+),score=17.67 TRINITY_DN17672_c0_g1_i1:72-623(+)
MVRYKQVRRSGKPVQAGLLRSAVTPRHTKKMSKKKKDKLKQQEEHQRKSNKKRKTSPTAATQEPSRPRTVPTIPKDQSVSIEEMLDAVDSVTTLPTPLSWDQISIGDAVVVRFVDKSPKAVYVVISHDDNSVKLIKSDRDDPRTITCSKTDHRVVLYALTVKSLRALGENGKTWLESCYSLIN